MGFKDSGSDIADYQTNQANLMAQQYKLAQMQMDNPYDPDIAGLQQAARENSLQNALFSQRLENQINPGVASTRAGLQSQIADDLATGGQLDTATANNLIRGGLGSALSSTGGTLGGNSQGLKGVSNNLLQGTYNRRLQNQQKAASLLSGNQLPSGGIDSSSIAGLLSSANQANYENPINQFNSALTNQGNAYNTAAALNVQNKNAYNQNLAGLYGAGLNMAGSLGGAALRR